MLAITPILSIIILTGVSLKQKRERKKNQTPTGCIHSRRPSRGSPFHEVQVRHPRGAQVRHPRGAQLDTHEVHQLDTHEVHMLDTHEVHQLRHPRGAPTEEDLQARSSVYYQVRHPRGAPMEEDLQAIFCLLSC
jgi:hypothetical protein